MSLKPCKFFPEIDGEEKELDYNQFRVYLSNNMDMVNKALAAVKEVTQNPLQKLEDEYRSKPVEELVKLKKELYSNMDIESPKSPEEKLLEKVIADKFSEKNKEIGERRANKKAQQSPTAKNFTDARDKVYEGANLTEEERDEALSILAQYGITQKGSAKVNAEGFEILLTTRPKDIAEDNGTAGQKIADWVKSQQTQFPALKEAADARPETNIGKPQKNSPEQRQKLVQSTLAVFSRLGSLTGSTMDIITDPNEIDRIKAAHKIGQIMRAGDEVLGFVHNGKVYVDPRVANEKTPIHEAGHVWLNFMEQTNPTFFDHGIRLIKEQTAYIKEAKRILNTTVESMPVYKEALALAIADEGARAQRISGTDKVKNFLRSMYEKIGKMFRINLTPDEISKLSFEDFTRSAAYWLTSGDPDLLDTQDPIMKQFLANQEKRILDKRSWLKKAISTLSNAMVAVSGLWRSMPYLRGVGFGEIKNILGQMKRVMGAAMVGSKAQVEAIYSGMTKDEADILGLYTNLLAIREEIAEGIHDDIPGDTEISFGITKDNIGQAIVDYAEKLDQNPAIRAAFETRKQIFKDLYQRGVDVGMYSADKGWEYYYRRIRQDAIESKYTNTLADLLRNAWRGRGNSTISTKKATTSVFKSREVFRGDFYTNSKEVDMDALVLMNIGIGIREKINRIKQVYQKDVLDAYLESQKVGTEMFKLETGRTRQTAITRIKKSIQPAIDTFFNSPIPPVEDRTDDIEMADMEVRAKLRAQKTSREWAKSFLGAMGSNAVEFGPREKAIYGNLQQELYHKLYKAYRVIALNKISDPDVIQGISNAIKGMPSREFRKHYNKQVYTRFLQMMDEKGFAAFYPEGFARQMGNKLLNNMAFDAGSQDVQDIIQRFNVDVNQAIAAYKTAATKDGAEVMWAPQEVVDTLNDMAPVTKNQMMENIKQGIRGFISKYKVFQLINPLNIANYLFTNLTGNSIRYAEVGGNLAYLKKAIESLGNISAEERAQLMELNVLNSGDLTQDYTIGMTGFKTASGGQFSKLMADVKAALLNAKSLSDAKEVFAQYLKERGVSSLFGDATDSYVGMARAMDNLFTDIYRYATYLKAIDQIRRGYTPNLGANLYDMMDIGTEQERAAYGASKAFGDYSSASRYMGLAADYGILPYVRYMNTMVMQFYGQRLLNILRRATMDLKAGKSKAEVAGKFTTETGAVVLGMTAVYIAGQVLSNMLIDDDDEEKRMLTDTGGDGIAFGKDPEGNNRMIRLGAPGQDFMRMLGIISAYNHYLSGAGNKLDDKVLDDMGAEIYGMVGPMVKVPLSVATGKNKMYDFGSEAPVTSNFDLFVRALPGNAVSRAGFNQIGALFGEDVEPTPDDRELILGATPVKKTAYAMEIQGKVRELLEVNNLTKPLPTKTGTEEQQDFFTAQRNAYKTLLLGKADEFMPRFEKYVEKGGDIKTLEKFIERKIPLSRISKKNQAALYEFAFGGDGVIELAHTTPMMASEVFTEEDRKLIRLSLETWKEQDEKVYNTFVEALSK